MFDDANILRCGFQQIADYLKLSRGGTFDYYPEKCNLLLQPGQTYSIDRQIGKSLLFLSVDVPEGVQMEIKNDRSHFAYFEQQAGGFPMPGIRFASMQVEVRNTTAEPARWSLMLSWGSD